MKVLLVDDEPLARDELAFLLGELGGVEVGGEAVNARDALQWLEGNHADAVFVDLHMPGPDGLALCSTLRAREEPPQVVIVSAHEETAARAFEAGAQDYLLKPVRLGRLRQCVDRLRDAPKQSSRSESSFRVSIKQALGYVIVDLRDALYFEVQSDGLTMVLTDSTHTLDLSLSDIEQRLAGLDSFFRCHRRALVRIDAIASYETHANGGGRVTIGHPSKPTVQVARERMRELKRLLPVAG